MRTLLTRDGRQIGNAIVIREVKPHPAAAEYLTKTGQKMWLVETDFGNQCRLSDNEINELFFTQEELDLGQAAVAQNADYEKWSADRRRLINSTRVVPEHES